MIARIAPTQVPLVTPRMSGVASGLENSDWNVFPAPGKACSYNNCHQNTRQPQIDYNGVILRMSLISRENIAENSDYVANRHIHPAEADTDQCGDKRQQYHEENGKRCKMPPFDQKIIIHQY